MDTLLAEATDPSDWDHDFTILRNLDASLRCDLCFDIYKSPVSIKSCQHTFCSACIRTHINQHGNSGSFCPKCRQHKAYDSELVPQPVLETTALEWIKAREFIARLQKQRKDEQAARDIEVHQERQHASTSSSTHRNGNIGRSHSDETPPRRSKRTKVDVHAYREVAAGSRSSPLTLDDEEDDVVRTSDGENDFDELETTRRRRRRGSDQDGDYSDPVSIAPAPSTDEQRELRPSDTVACPICQHKFTMTALNRHLDTGKCFPGCPAPTAEQQGLVGSTNSNSSAPFGSARPKSGSAWFTSTASSTAPILANEKRLTRPQYNLKNDRDLRALLSDVGLPTTGDRDKLMERHRQWINLWNANLDSTKARKPAGQLRKELASWEKHRTGAKDLSGMVERQKKSWATTNKQQFDELIKTAKEGAAKNKQLREQQAIQDREPSHNVKDTALNAPVTREIAADSSSNEDVL